MAASSLLTLIDDIATVLDDVAVLSKVAAKKTSGVLGDDLALNAEQVSGVRAERELPVVWAVAKGSFKNKFILVPSALLISAVAPWLIPYLLIIGGLFLCFEGMEKVVHKMLQSKEDRAEEKAQKMQAMLEPDQDLAELEQQKIKGAIRTDFILSAEIIVIVLGTVQTATFNVQVSVLAAMAILFTVGVYGLVAAIVKLDDLGLYLLNKGQGSGWGKLNKPVGKGLLLFAPQLMRMLAVVGTIAMFLVGGGILVHNIPALHHLLEPAIAWAKQVMGVFSAPVPMLLDGVMGMLAGTLLLAIIAGVKKLRAS